ncbi:MAG: hypothetical protein PHZ11_03115 [Desulfitobacteriaceae bacterium]|nr:hypothetical protein [Desulfitobacteriaceae bacterium]
MSVFRPDFQTGFRNKQTGKCVGRLGRALMVCLLCALALIASFTPSPTYSRYVVNLSDSFTLNSSAFYLVPSLALNELAVVRAESFFTQGNDFSVANYLGSKNTPADTAFTIALEEERATCLFDLYLDDGTEGKILCPNNTIGGTLDGGTAATKTYPLFFKLKDSATPEGNYPINLRLTSSEPYIRSYLFRINIQVPGSLTEIGDTEIYRPDVEIPAGEIMVFKDNGYEFLTVDDLLSPLVVNQEVENRERPDLIGGSLYVPASVGDLLVQSYWPNDEIIDWDVEGHIILEPDIIIEKNSEIKMLSHRGDVILNGTIISGQPQPYKVSITAENGTIDANGTKILSKADSQGEIILEAKNDINLNGAELTSAGSHGINIQAQEGNINAANALLKSTNGAGDAGVIIRSSGQINLDGATVESNGGSNPPASALLIESSTQGISAQNATLKSFSGGKSITIQSQGLLDLDQAMISGKGQIYLNSSEDISSVSAQISASSNNLGIHFKSSGLNRLLWAANAALSSNSITAQNLTVNGTPASGSITVIP